jgi:hypothetical protein
VSVRRHAFERSFDSCRATHRVLTDVPHLALTALSVSLHLALTALSVPLHLALLSVSLHLALTALSVSLHLALTALSVSLHLALTALNVSLHLALTALSASLHLAHFSSLTSRTLISLQHDKALAYHKQALDIRTLLLPVDHPDLVKSRSTVRDWSS